ncbi:M14 family zinc carboxypeptidase [Kitasatospora sp. NPDC050463]|uniref:M14 family zinc carboxypeptidase n=1 Tax=Kitasatospora sp. NPDC050463 TaxID=3155786 RepID=UPI0033CCB464
MSENYSVAVQHLVKQGLAAHPPGGRIPSVETVGRHLAHLAAQNPGLCHLRRVGSSRQGRALDLLSIGQGERSVLVVGGPHPNEPVGYATITFLSTLLVERPELRRGASWHFLPCVDPDGAALNSAWTSSELDLALQHRYFFRPALAEQPEWTFPIAFGGEVFRFSLPETDALAAVVDELRPAVTVSLHNSDFGAAFFILSRDEPDLAVELSAAASLYGLAGGAMPTDTRGWHRSGPAAFVMPPADQLIIRDQDGDRPSHGSHCGHYAERYGTLTVMPEVPRWRVGTTVPGGRPAVLRAEAEQLGSALDQLAALHQLAGSPKRTSFGRGLADTFAVAATLGQSLLQRAATGHPVSNEEAADVAFTRVQLSLRAAGMLVREFEHQPPATAERAVTTQLAEARRLLSSWAGEVQRELELTPYPLVDLVGLQAHTALATAARLT